MMKFLHISDLHFDPVNDGVATRDLREKFLKYALEKNITDVNEVFFTGDFRHAKKQKDQNVEEVAQNAVDFLRYIASCVGVKDEQHIHIVPGNHDLNREKNDEKNCQILNAIYNNYDEINGRFTWDKKVSALAYLRNRFGFFEKCANMLNNQRWADFKNGLSHRVKPRQSSEAYSILYLNTAIASGDRTIKHKLLIGTDDFDKALRQTSGQLIIVLAHNPLSHLESNEQNYIKNIIKEKKTPVLWLCGDTHISEYDNSYNIVCVTTGSMVQEEGSEASFNVGEFTVHNGLTITAHRYVANHRYWQPEEALSKRIAESIPENLKPRIKELTINNNLPERNQYFSGRDNDFVSIDLLFKEKDNKTVNICQTVAGLGGVGKTQLAIEYAYRYGGNYENCVWFIVSESSTTVYNYFIDFANHFKITLPPDFKPEDLQWAIKSWLHDHNNWFLIFDNLENYADIKPYLPNSNNGHYIITTRKDNIGVGAKLGLGVFNMEEALEFLQKRLVGYGRNELNFTDFNEMASILVDRLGCLPLALAQAAAYTVKVKCSISTYLKYIEESDLKVFDDEYATPEHYEAIVNTTWKISRDALSQEAQWLFNLCAYMAPDRIPVNFFVEMRHKLPDELSTLRDNLGEVGTRARIIASLFEYSLASGNNEYISIHRLVQEVVRKSHEEENAS